MIAEVLCIGTELLLGDILNTNAVYFAQELSSIGINLYYISTVGDNKERIKKSIDIALSRADILITSGGLGPTEDDITHECIAEYLGVEQEFHQDVAEKIKFFFNKIRKKEMPQSNLTQAYFPKGSTIIENNHGTAPGIIYNKNGQLILTFPGVPSELKGMWSETAKPYLEKNNSEKSTIKSITLRFYGEGESAIAEKVSDFLNNANPTVAPYAGKSEARLRITAKAESETEAYNLIEPVKNEILNRLGEFFYGYEEDTLQGVIMKNFQEKNLTLAILEVSTSGVLINRFSALEKFEETLVFSAVIKNKEQLSKLLNINIEGDFFNKIVLEKIATALRFYANTDIAIVTDSRIVVDEKTSKKIGNAIISISTEDRIITKEIAFPKHQKEDLDYYTSQVALNMLKKEIFK